MFGRGKKQRYAIEYVTEDSMRGLALFKKNPQRAADGVRYYLKQDLICSESCPKDDIRQINVAEKSWRRCLFARNDKEAEAKFIKYRERVLDWIERFSMGL